MSAVNILQTCDIWACMEDENPDARTEIRYSFDGIISQMATSIHVYLLHEHMQQQSITDCYSQPHCTTVVHSTSHMHTHSNSHISILTAIFEKNIG